MFKIERKVFYYLTQVASHIYRRIERLIKDEIILNLDFSVFDTCA